MVEDTNRCLDFPAEEERQLSLFMCNLCCLASIDCYHCVICEYDVCITCLKTGSWCKGKEHTIYRQTSQRSKFNQQNLETIIFGAFCGQRLQILDTSTSNAKVQEIFCRHSGSMIDSCPIIHPSRSLVFWLIGGGQLLVGNLSINSHEVQMIMQSAKSKSQFNF